MPDPLPYARQSIDDADIAAVVDALRDDLVTTGPRVAAFERALCEVTGARHAAVVSSGTAALHLAYAALGIGRGDEVVTTPLTFAATANAALFTGARVVFSDVDAVTGTLDPALLDTAVTPRTRAIVPVDFAGHPADHDAIGRVAARHGVPVIADAAHSLGASYRGRRVGTLAAASTLSFHPVKAITTLEGGAVLTDDPALHRAVVELRSHGIVRDRERSRRADGPWQAEMQALGFNYRLPDVACALGISQLSKLEAFIDRRRAIAAAYTRAFAGDERLVVPAVCDGVEPAWHLYVLRVAGSASLRRPFFEALRHRGLGVQLHYVPVYRHPYYEDIGYREGLCPVAEQFSARSVSLPIFPAMTDADVERVISDVRSTADEVLA